jgi:hypothetical protein
MHPWGAQGRPECALTGRRAACSEIAFQRGTALAPEHNRNEINKPLSSESFEGGNRPQRLGGAGTRHRMAFHELPP